MSDYDWLHGDEIRKLRPVIQAMGGYYLPMTTYSVLPTMMGTSGVNPFIGTVGSVGGYIKEIHYAAYVVTTNNASNYWNLGLRGLPGGTSLHNGSTAAISPSAWTRISYVGLSIDITSLISIYLYITKTGSPGLLDLSPPALWVEYVP